MSTQSTGGAPAAEQKGSGLGAGAVASLLGVGVIALFILQNRQEVPVNFLIWHFTWPLWLYGLIMAVFGAIVWFGMGVMRRRSRRKARREKR